MDTNTAFTPSNVQIDLMQHALGISEHNRNDIYRNYFYVDGRHSHWDELVTHGYATVQKAPAFTSGGVTYHCTERGRIAAICAIPEPEKLTGGKQKYNEYLRSECCESFAEWLGIEVPERDYCYWGEDDGKVRLRSSRATGEYCKTLKDAKASYKAALKAKKEGAYVYY
ncbi:hypothetical protein [Limnobaculum xujianqingii]|uniref:hypothetical protein n=1 Tax=Limnobaculum xujianqingii TaxID=2738837 RepID=UPI0011272584|nr:hypothetical protein [Limnobaculum xujianqingii]